MAIYVAIYGHIWPYMNIYGQEGAGFHTPGMKAIKNNGETLLRNKGSSDQKPREDSPTLPSVLPGSAETKT